MSVAMLDAPTGLFAARTRETAAGGRGTTLEQLLDATWHAARSHAGAECPVCQAPMRMEGERARCRGCGSTLT